jgi:hypothetical protein
MSKRKITNCSGPCTLCSIGLKFKTCTLEVGFNGFHPADDADLIMEVNRIHKRVKLANNATELAILAKNLLLIEEELIKRNIL